MIREKFDKITDKIYDRVTNGSKKDQRIKELWDALNHAYSCMETYGSHLSEYEANLKWRPPQYFHKGEYTMEDRLEDVRWRSEKIRECAEEIRKVMFSHTDVD